MDIQTRKIAFVQAFLKLQSEELITRFEELLKAEKREIEPMSVETFNERIDKSLNDSKNNKLTSASDLLDEIDEWQ